MVLQKYRMTKAAVISLYSSMTTTMHTERQQAAKAVFSNCQITSISGMLSLSPASKCSARGRGRCWQSMQLYTGIGFAHKK